MTDVPERTRQMVYERDGHRCVKCGRTSHLTIQHIRARGMGGTRDPRINAPSNLITLCWWSTDGSGCHPWVEDHPELAERAGWSRPRSSGPAPVLYSDGTLRMLTDDFMFDSMVMCGPELSKLLDP